MGKRARNLRRLAEELKGYHPHSMSYVILHAELQKLQGLPPIMPYCGIKNPHEALFTAKLDCEIRTLFWELEERDAKIEGRPALQPIPLPPAPQPEPTPPRGSWGTKLAVGILQATYDR